jgi:hypothetical protein
VVEAEAGAGAGAARQMKRPREAVETPHARRGAEKGAGAGRRRPGTGCGARMARREEEAVAMRGGGALEDCGPQGSFAALCFLSIHKRTRTNGCEVPGPTPLTVGVNYPFERRFIF